MINFFVFCNYGVKVFGIHTWTEDYRDLLCFPRFQSPFDSFALLSTHNYKGDPRGVCKLKDPLIQGLAFLRQIKHPF